VSGYDDVLHSDNETCTYFFVSFAFLSMTSLLLYELTWIVRHYLLSEVRLMYTALQMFVLL